MYPEEDGILTSCLDTELARSTSVRECCCRAILVGERKAKLAQAHVDCGTAFATKAKREGPGIVKNTALDEVTIVYISDDAQSIEDLVGNFIWQE